MLPKYSIVVPVYNRPHELLELLESLMLQDRSDIEVIVVEDGSTIKSDVVVEQFANRLPIRYIFKDNSGPGPSRNLGFQHARGDYFVVFDSDCILPPNYFHAVDQALANEKLDAWGGPDKGHENFTVLQRAMAYSMSSVLTTGGIRGGKKHVGWFQPRSFNMGISKEVFIATGGFHFDRYAEDIEFSIRMKNKGFRVGLVPDAFVFHKRRTSLGAFYRQVFNFGRGRVLVGKKFPAEVKLAHWIPSLFVAGVIVTFIMPLLSVPLFQLAVAALVAYFAAIFFHSLVTTKSLAVAFMSVPATIVQFFGYGLGFLTERFRR